MVLQKQNNFFFFLTEKKFKYVKMIANDFSGKHAGKRKKKS